MWKNSGGKIISCLVGALVTLIIFIFGFSGVVTHDDIEDFVTKDHVLELIPEESEYIKDQRMILEHMKSTQKTLDQLVEKLACLDKTLAALTVELNTMKEKINMLPIHNSSNSLSKQDR